MRRVLSSPSALTWVCILRLPPSPLSQSRPLHDTVIHPSAIRVAFFQENVKDRTLAPHIAIGLSQLAPDVVGPEEHFQGARRQEQARIDAENAAVEASGDATEAAIVARKKLAKDVLEEIMLRFSGMAAYHQPARTWHEERRGGQVVRVNDNPNIMAVSDASVLDAAVKKVGRVQVMADRIREELGRALPRNAVTKKVSARAFPATNGTSWNFRSVIQRRRRS
jgi:hypothetical protein